MSGFFGIFNCNGKPVEKEIITTMLDAISYWDPDETGVWSEGSVALGHAMLWNTPESKYETFPLNKDVYVLTMDARIDNRDELLEELELPNRPSLEMGDSEFILAAYKRWGVECPKYLLGDFSFAIWDEKKQQMFCARDHVGVKQFYYHLSDELFLFGNDLKVLTQYPNISQTINDEAVANYIVNHQLLSHKITFFESFIKLPPAHTLVVSKTNTEVKCYWRLEDAPRVKLPNAEAYAAKLRELLEKAVYARMRSDYTITSHLSGGLDSSSIAVLAARKLKEKGEKLLAFNWLHEPGEKDDPEHYEWANSRLIAKVEGIEHHYVTLTAEDIYKYMSERDIAYGETATFWYEYPVREAAQKKGSRTILSGWGGDELATYHGQSFYANLFMYGKFLRLIKELRVRMKKRKGIKPILSFIYHNVFIPLVPRTLYCKMPKVTCDEASFPFIKKEFMHVIEKEQNKSRLLTRQPQKTIRDHMLAYWGNSHIQSRIESWEIASFINHLEYTYPLLDKRILELAVSVPVEYFINSGNGRYIFYLVAKEYLPKKILSVQKVYEPNRIHHLSMMTLVAFKLVLDRKSAKDNMNYINFNEAYNQLNKIVITSKIDKKTIEIFEHLESTISIFFSNFLQKNMFD